MGKILTVNNLGIVLIVGLSSFLCYSLLNKKTWEDLFSEHAYINSSDTLLYRYYAPDYNEGQKIPLLIYLHGAAENGNNNKKQLTGGLVYFMRDSIKANYPCAIFAPQCPKSTNWVDTDIKSLQNTVTPRPAKPMEMVFTIIDSLKKLEYIDSNRIYITGISYGGFGTWDAITRRPGLFAAAVPLCGGGDTSKASSISRVNVWAFHGDRDDVVAPAQTGNMVTAIKSNGGNPKMSILPNTGHYICDKAYTEPGFMKWLFSQTNKAKGN